MATPYFRQVPNFDYVSRLSGSKNISDYVQVKNLFKRAKLRQDIIGNLEFFENYTIIGDERPDNVANKFYDDPTLDWIILLSNNILNIQDEWPMTQRAFDEYLLEKYGTYQNIYATHHYESTEVRNSSGVIMVPAGLRVPQDYSVKFYDFNIGGYTEVPNVAREVTNYEYEDLIQDKKRTILVLKSDLLRLVLDDIERVMTYKQGSSQYVTETLKRGQNIRLYE